MTTSQKIHVVLDLDQTLIHALTKNEYDALPAEEKSRYFVKHVMDEYYIIHERPGVQKFLDYIFANFKVSVWTAASKDYAVFVIDNVILTKPDRKLEYVFFSHHCEMSKKYYKGLKQLDMLSEKFHLPMGQTFIVDDNNEVHGPQPNRCVHIPEFDVTTGTGHEDNKMHLLLMVMEELKGHGDVAKAVTDANNRFQEESKAAAADEASSASSAPPPRRPKRKSTPKAAGAAAEAASFDGKPPASTRAASFDGKPRRNRNRKRAQRMV